jgi:hypothetical protein
MQFFLVDMVSQAERIANAQGCLLSDTCLVAKHALLLRSWVMGDARCHIEHVSLVQSMIHAIWPCLPLAHP